MKVRLRTQQVYIDRPVPTSEDWLRVIIQRVEMDDDGNTLNLVDRWGQVNVKLSTIFGRVFDYIDPVPSQEGQISVAGTGSAITAIVTDLIIEKYGGTLDKSNGWIMVQ